MKLRVGFKIKQLSRLPVTNNSRFRACESTIQAVENGTGVLSHIAQFLNGYRKSVTFEAFWGESEQHNPFF
jgi:hypothetical protein